MQSEVVRVDDSIEVRFLEKAVPFNSRDFDSFFWEKKNQFYDNETQRDLLIREMNKFLCICNEGANCSGVWIYHDHSVESEELAEWSPLPLHKAQTLFKSWIFFIKIENPESKKTSEKTNVFKFWSESRSQRRVAEIIFNPRFPSGFIFRQKSDEDGASTTKLLFNTWIGGDQRMMVPLMEWEKELADERLSKILFHLKAVIARGNDELYDYLLEWMASLTQKPWVKIPVVPVICGIQGAGKSMFWENFCKLFGVHGLVTPDPSLITDKYYGSDLAKKVLVVVSETNFASNTKEASAMKNQITSTTRRAEKKYQDIKIQKDFVNMIFTSNLKSQAFPVEKSSNRRWLLIEADGALANQKQYFDELDTAFNDDKFIGLRALCTYLVQYPLGNVNLKLAPHTEEKADVVLSQFNELENWWSRCLKNQFHTNPTEGVEVDPNCKKWVTNYASKKQLFQNFLFSLRTGNEKNWDNETVFESQFKQFLPPLDEGLPDLPYANTTDVFVMPYWKTCLDYFRQLKGISNPIQPTIVNKKRAGEPLSNDRNKITRFFRRADD